MCERGQTSICYVASMPVEVDSCIASIVEALNRAGIKTVASCCGHGFRPGTIALADGRELFVVANFDEARRLDSLFPTDINGVTRVRQPDAPGKIATPHSGRPLTEYELVDRYDKWKRLCADLDAIGYADYKWSDILAVLKHKRTKEIVRALVTQTPEHVDGQSNRITCPECHGTGGIPSGSSEEIFAGRLDRCDRCDGFGHVESAPLSPLPEARIAQLIESYSWHRANAELVQDFRELLSLRQRMARAVELLSDVAHDDWQWDKDRKEFLKESER